MKIEQITYNNSLTPNIKAKKSFYKNEVSEDAITFSSELDKENSSNEGLFNNQQKNDHKENEETDENTSLLKNNKNNDEKLNIII